MKIGELFAGYGGLGLGVKAALGGEVAWVSDIDPGANKILEHRFPDVPNLGDITQVDWSQVEPVDVLTGGFPCQDVSTAGKRAGIRPGTRSGLWSQFAYAIDQLRPELVVIENVRGLLSAKAHSDVEPCPWCMGDPEEQPPLRALGAVLGDLAAIGFDAEWIGLPASRVGAPHGRFRVFIVAYPSGGRRREGWSQPARLVGRPDVAERGGAALLPTPRSSDSNGAGVHGDGGIDLRTAVTMLPTPRASRGGSATETVALLPTPAVNDMGEGKTVDAWDEWTATMQAKHGNGNGHGKSLAIEAQRLLPTPKARDAVHEGYEAGLRRQVPQLGTIARAGEEGRIRWGDYAPAIARWERVLGRPAPAPTETGPKGSPRLSPRFVEWMMGLPAGWVTDAPGLTRNAQLKALGNGVVPAQAEAALRIMLARDEAAA